MPITPKNVSLTSGLVINFDFHSVPCTFPRYASLVVLDITAALLFFGKDRLVQKGHTSGFIPTAIGVQRTRVVSTGCFIIVMIILYKERSIFRQRIDHPAAQLIASIL